VSKVASKFGIFIRRMEVHAVGRIHDEDEKLGPRWKVSIDSFNNKILINAYLSVMEKECFGQAQAAAVVLDEDTAALHADPEKAAAFTEWAASYCFEVMYDVLRRALQSQAALMDFQFDLDQEAPEPELDVDYGPLRDSRAESETADIVE